MVVLDVTGVKLVARELVEFLAGFATARSKITDCAPYIREWIRREQEPE